MTNRFSLLKLSRFFLYLAPFTVLIVSRSTLFPFIVGKYFFFRAVVDLALISFLWAWARGEITFGKIQPINKNRPQPFVVNRKLIFNPLTIAISIFVLIFLLAGFFGYNPSASFWSNFERGEGGLQMLHLFFFFILLVLLFRDEKSWRRMMAVFLWAAGLMIAYGLGAAMGISSFIGSGICARFVGSLGNPAYVGTHMIFALFFTAILVNEGNARRKRWLKWLLGILLVIFFITLLFSQTRGALLGLGVGVIAGLVYLFFNLSKGRTKKIVLAAIIILIITGGLGFKYRRSIDLMPFCKGGGNRILDINLSTETIQTRFLLWRQAIVIAKERPLLGWGPENFSPAFEKHSLPQFKVWFDRAHSVYFDYLAETGILGLLGYLGIWLAFLWQFLRFGKRPAANNPQQTQKPQSPAVSRNQSLIGNALIFALSIAHLVQGIVLFEVLPIYISLFIFLAFAAFRFNNKDLI
ncbi:MAG: O-antigen ligase family protein [Candidatus Paceibacterota bacterium]